MFTEERERRRIADELHDLTGQSLAIAKIKLREIQESLSGDNLKKLLCEIEDSIEHAIDCTRSLVFRLSPPVLYELGLGAALEWLGEQVQQKHAIKVSFHDDGKPRHLSQETRVTLFKAVRELLLNIIKHAGARNIAITIARNGPYIEVTVRDDGVGFDIARPNLRTSQGGGGFGLFSIREKLRFLGGRMKMKSEPGKGTECTLIAPL
jgi:signal transduction histidine kinase